MKRVVKAAIKVVTLWNVMFLGVLILQSSCSSDKSVAKASEGVSIDVDANDRATNEKGVSFEGACDSRWPVILSGDFEESPLEESCDDGRYIAELTLTDAEGDKIINVSQTDDAEQTSTVTHAITYDITVPVAGDIISPVADQLVGLNGVMVSGACEVGVSVVIGGAADPEVIAECVAVEEPVEEDAESAEGEDPVDGEIRKVVQDTGDEPDAGEPDAEEPAEDAALSGEYSAYVLLVGTSGVEIAESVAISITHRDLAGNVSEPQEVSVSLDAFAPPLTGDASPSNVTDVTINGTCEDALEVTVTDAGSLGSGTFICSGGAFSYVLDLGTPSEGDSFEVEFSQEDDHGNVTTSSHTIVYDTIAPVVDISGPVDGSFTNLVSQTVSGSCEDGLAVNIAGDIVEEDLAAVCASSSYSQLVTLSAGDGSKEITVSQIDLAKNKTSETRVITLDQTVPDLTLAEPAKNSLTITLMGDCEDGLPVVISGTLDSTSVTEAICSASSYEQEIVLTSDVGEKTVTVAQTDLSGNPTTVSRTFSVDLEAPGFTVDVPAADFSTQSLGPHTFSGSCEVDVPIVISGATPSEIVCNEGSYSADLSLPDVDGPNAVILSQTDASENSVAVTTNIILDREAPVLTLDILLANTLSHTLEGDCEGDYAISFSGAGITAIEGVCAAGRYGQAVDLTSGSDGVRVVIVEQTDAVGLSSSESFNIVLDTTAPVVSVDGWAVQVNQLTQTVAGNCENGLPVWISGNIAGSPVTAACTSTRYSQSVTLTSGDGGKSISVTQTDAVGNVSTPATASTTLDTTAPVVSVDGWDLQVNQLTQTVAGDCENSLSVMITGNISGAPVAATCTSTRYSQSVTLTSGDGVKSITVTQTDDAGNLSIPATASTTLDRTAPVVSVDGWALQVNQLTQTVAGNCEDGLSVMITGNISGAPVTATCTSTRYSQSVMLTSGDGGKSISVTQADVAGNVSTPATASTTLDRTAPVVSVDGWALPVNQLTQTVAGNCENGLPVWISGNIEASPVAATCSSTAYSQSVTLTSGDGVKSISVTQTDVAGNLSIPATASTTLDRTAPVVSVDGWDLQVNQLTQTVAGNCENSLSVMITGNIIGSPVTATCTSTRYSQSVTLTSGDGGKSISVTQTDAVGNVSTPATASTTLDTAAPTLTATGLAATTTAVAQVITGDCENGLPVELTGDIVSNISETCSSTTYSASITLTSGTASKTVTVTQTDNAGNSSTQTLTTSYTGSKRVQLSVSEKSLSFDWEAATEKAASHYRLMVSTDGGSSFHGLPWAEVIVGTGYTWDRSEHTLGWTNVDYKVQVCSVSSCRDHGVTTVSVSDFVVAALYDEASKVESKELGHLVSFSDDGNTFSVGAFFEESTKRTDKVGSIHTFTRSEAGWEQLSHTKATEEQMQELSSFH